MALKITTECILCGACEPECPNQAIYPNGADWSFAAGTSLTSVELDDGTTLDARQPQPAISDSEFYIVSFKCTECVGFHEEPQCAAICPVDCCVSNPDSVETAAQLQQKKEWLHEVDQ